MREIYRFCFEQFTDQLSFSLSPVAEWIVTLLLHEVVFRLAFRRVGELYRAGVIHGRSAGSFLHWLFRGISFAIAWMIVNSVIAVYRLITEHWLMIIGVICGIALLTVVGVLLYRVILQRRENKPTTNIPV